MTRSYKRRNRKTRRSKKRLFRKNSNGGGLIAMYEEPVVTQDTEYRNNSTREFLMRAFITSGGNGCLFGQGGGASPYFHNGMMAIYLNGYGNFIGPNKLFPIYYNNTKSESMARMFGEPKPTHVKQVFYYISQFVYDCCIITTKQATFFKEFPGYMDSFVGYKGVSPVITGVKTGQHDIPFKFLLNDHDLYGDKFMVYPKSNAMSGDPNYRRITYTFTPTRETNIYEVPGVGEVIMNDPENGEPWFDETVTVVFDHGFIPPKINRENTIDDDVGISQGTFAAVGADMATRE